MTESALWTSEEIASATGGVANTGFAVSGVAFDSREIVRGDLFIAMKGEATDGHRFIEKALAAGASGVLCENAITSPHVRVSDSVAALDALGIAARLRSQAQIVGVTGSAGKTSTKEALYKTLERAAPGRAHCSVKSYNNHVGVPLSLARMPANARYGVFEMGMNHKDELSALTRLVRPDVAIITTIAPAHIGHFRDEAEIADAKGEIFEGLEPGGTAIIPRDNPHFERLFAAASAHADNIMTFGRHPSSDARVLDHVRATNGGSLVTAEIGDRRLCYTVAAPGEHWVMNSLAIMAAVHALGADLAVAGLALAELPGLAGRGARVRIALPGGEALLIDESYNANPASMAATIGGLGEERADRRIAVLGAMKELGALSDTYHSGLAAPLASASVDKVILVGDEMHILAETLRKSLAAPDDLAHVATASEALKVLKSWLQPGDSVLVKGSNAMGLSALVTALGETRASEEV
ncbi:MAG: UDP-N-acetylmuramoyl-tripeptide--D-alanyl-D-alanine ligase [Blastomonas sp.]